MITHDAMTNKHNLLRTEEGKVYYLTMRGEVDL